MALPRCDMRVSRKKAHDPKGLTIHRRSTGHRSARHEACSTTTAMIRALPRLAVTLAAMLLLAGSAEAATAPELRAEAARASVGAHRLAGQRAELQKRLDEVAGRIEKLKAQRAAAGALLNDSELDAALKRSQELSAELNDVLRRQSQAEDALQATRVRLVEELDRELAKLQARWDQSGSREEKAGLLPLLGALRDERESLRRELPARQGAVPALKSAPSDDPEALFEQADALLDSADKLRREEEAIARRIQELQSERELDRRMNEFMSEGSLFDETDRRISVSRTVRGQNGLPVEMTDGSSSPPGFAQDTVDSPGKNVSNPPPPAGPVLSDPPRNEKFSESAETSLIGSNFNARQASPTLRDSQAPGAQSGAEQLVDDGRRSGTLRMPPNRGPGIGGFSDDDSLEELQARQAKLRGLAADLEKKADEAMKRARELE